VWYEIDGIKRFYIRRRDQLYQRSHGDYDSIKIPD
jgi:hypothetical protein